MPRGKSSAGSRPPAGLRATRFEHEGEPLVVFSYSTHEPEPASALAEALTPAQLEVASLVLAGHSNQEIAARRGTATATVAKQLELIYRRLGINSRRELAALAGRSPPARRRSG